jgi:NADH-quinone oxidoreductase subunit N
MQRVEFSEFLYNNKILILGVLLFLCALMFKITAAPFHMWGPDVYQGSPTIVTFFFSLVPKLVFLFFLIRLNFVLSSLIQPWSSFIFFFCGVFSLILGAVSSISQIKIKRLLAYSSISNVGYFLVALCPGSFEGFVSCIFFMIIYIFTSTSFFAILISTRYFSNNLKLKNISDFFSLTASNIPISICLLSTLFSLLGLPPFAGFFSKVYLFLVLVSGQFFSLLFFSIIASILSAFIYLRLIRVVFFNKLFLISFFTPISSLDAFVIMFCSLFNIVVFLDSDFFFFVIFDSLLSEIF